MGCLRRRAVDVKWLGIVALGERNDFVLGELDRQAREFVADLVVLEPFGVGGRL